MTTAAPAKKGLGKGLSALMGEEYSSTAVAKKPGAGNDSAENAPITSLPVNLIHSGKFQPRHHFNEEYLSELADSIEKNGIMQPITVRPSPDKISQYEIIAGERRWRAAKLAKLKEIPVIVRDVNDQTALELALVENVQRQDLTPLEEASGYQRLMDEFKYTQEVLARTVGKSRSHIANLLRLQSLPDEIKKLLETDKLSMGHARTLLNTDTPLEFAKQIVREGLNVRQAEELVRGNDPAKAAQTKAKPSTPAPRPSSPAREKDPDVLALEETLSQSLGLTVSINAKSGQVGEVVIQYGSLMQLDEILRRLGDVI